MKTFKKFFQPFFQSALEFEVFLKLYISCQFTQQSIALTV